MYQKALMFTEVKLWLVSQIKDRFEIGNSITF